MNRHNTSPKSVERTIPTLFGRLGNAWLIDKDAAAKRLGIVEDPRFSVTLPSWIASAPYAHPVWSYYAILCIALRDVPGVPKAKINLEGATHEVMVFALDPDVVPVIDDTPRVLRPINFVGQFVATDDAAAEARIRQAVQDVIDGKLNPDTDHTRAWIEHFSDSNLLPGALEPDFIAAVPGVGLVAHGTGAANARKLQQIAELGATLDADEKKPQ